MKEKLSREFAKAFPVYRQPNSPSSFQKKAKKMTMLTTLAKHQCEMFQNKTFESF